jgi:regulator of replication initiation timing
MPNIEIALVVALAIMTIGIYIVTRFNRDLTVENSKLREQLDDSEEKNDILEKRIKEIDKKFKLSNDVLAVLNDMKQGGAVFEVTRIDRSDIFFHNGSQYR